MLLEGFSLYILVVTSGVQDLVGRTLSATCTSGFTTIDNILPALIIVFPNAGAKQIAPDAVSRLTFSEAHDPVSLDGIVLQQGCSTVAIRLDLVQEGRVVILTSLALLATAGAARFIRARFRRARRWSPIHRSTAACRSDRPLIWQLPP